MGAGSYPRPHAEQNSEQEFNLGGTREVCIECGTILTVDGHDFFDGQGQGNKSEKPANRCNVGRYGAPHQNIGAKEAQHVFNSGRFGAKPYSQRSLVRHGISLAISQVVDHQNGGGQGGEPGAAGEGGAGTEGKYINMRTLTGNRKWMAGGDEGQPGSAGKPGRDGVKGQALVQQDLRDRMDAVIQTQSAQVTALKDQLVARLAEEKRQVEVAAKQAISSLEAQVSALQNNLDSAANQTSVDQSIADIQGKLARQAARLDELSAKMEQSMSAMQSQLDALSKQVKGLDGRVNSLSGSERNQ